MTTELMIYKFKEYPIRITLDDKREPWFVAKDVGDVLGIKHIASSLRRIPDDEKGVQRMPTPGGDQMMAIISEAGRYRLTMRCDKPEAKPFQDWVVKEVLPSIRKTGAYISPTVGGALKEATRILSAVVETLDDHDRRLLELEKGKQAVALITAPVKEISTRSKISQVIREYAQHHDKDYKAYFHTLFYEFKYRYAIDLIQRTRNNGNKTIMDTAEECGCLDDLFALAVSLFVGK